MIKGRHVVKTGGRVVAEGDPAVLGLLATYFGTVYRISVQDTTGMPQTLDRVKPDSFAVGIANRNLQGTCATTDTAVGGTVMAEAVPSIEFTGSAYVLKAKFTPADQITFDTVYAVARYPTFAVLIYRGCHGTPITVGLGETVEVEISFTVS